MQASQHEELWFLNDRVSILRAADGHDDRTSIMKFSFPDDDASPLHVHEDEDEMFHLVSGTMRLQVGYDIIDLVAGRSILAPRGVPHAYKVTSAGGAVALVITVGGRFERVVRTAGRVAEAEGLPSPVEPSPAAIERLALAAAANGVTILGPSPF